MKPDVDADDGLVCLGPEDDPLEWDHAWQQLATRTGDADKEACDEEGQCWQFMGSYGGDRGWVHEFRHRNHPVLRGRWYVSVPATRGWQPPSVRKVNRA